jgi:hypothetical protein
MAVAARQGCAQMLAGRRNTSTCTDTSAADGSRLHLDAANRES